MDKGKSKTKHQVPAQQPKVVVGNVNITHETLDCGVVQLMVRVQEGGDSDTAIDTMLLAVLQICCGPDVNYKDVINRMAFRMGHIARTMIIDPRQVDA